MGGSEYLRGPDSACMLRVGHAWFKWKPMNRNIFMFRLIGEELPNGKTPENMEKNISINYF